MKVVLVVSDFSPDNEMPEFVRNVVSRVSNLPLGIFYITSYLEKYGFDVSVIDNCVLRLTPINLAYRIAAERPDIVGFSITTHTYPQAKKEMKTLKKMYNVPIVVGGVHPTLFPEEVAKEEFIDYVVVGEGEQTMLELCQKLQNKEDVGKKILTTKDFVNIDEIPFPARNHKNFYDYARGMTNYVPTYPVDTVASGRGCPFSCAFCSGSAIWKWRYRKRSAESVVDEIEFLKENFGSKGICFREDNFTVKRDDVLKFCDEMVSRKVNVPWMCESRVDAISDDLLQAMKNAGCSGMWFGVESGVQKTLDYLMKGITLEQTVRCMDLCKKYKIRTGASFMIGLPPETKEDITNSFEFAKKLNCGTVWFNQYLAIPNSAVYKEVKEKGYYTKEWNGIYAVQTPYMKYEELQKLEKEYNNYFRLRRWRTIIATRVSAAYSKFASGPYRQLASARSG